MYFCLNNTNKIINILPLNFENTFITVLNKSSYQRNVSFFRISNIIRRVSQKGYILYSEKEESNLEY